MKDLIIAVLAAATIACSAGWYVASVQNDELWTSYMELYSKLCTVRKEKAAVEKKHNKLVLRRGFYR